MCFITLWWCDTRVLNNPRTEDYTESVPQGFKITKSKILMQSPCLRSFLASTFFHGTHAQTRPKLFACTDGFPSLPSQLIDHWLYLIHEYNISWFNFFKSNLKEYITICFSIFLLRVKEHFYILFSFRLDLELIQCLQSSLQ